MAAPRSSRRRFDDDAWEPEPALAFHHPHHDLTDHGQGPAPDDDEPMWSTYRDAVRGPSPVPRWVVTDPRAIDVDHGVVKTGKEADVSVVERAVPDHVVASDPPSGAVRSLLAAKRYRSAEHRMFHRDAGYLEGRRVRRSREMRAMATRTAFGRELIAGQWAAAEFEVLGRLWSRGAAVPYPVQVLGTEVLMELIGDDDGNVAPRLAQLRPEPDLAEHLFRQMVDVLTDLAEIGFAHGDLSPYNVLVHGDRLVLIDLPQAVDLVGNPQGFDYLRRDCRNITTWFAAHGVPAATEHELYDRVTRPLPGFG